MQPTDDLRRPDVRLRAIAADDAEDVARFCADWDLARMTSRLPHPYTIEHARAFVADRPAEDTAFAIDCDGRLAGVVSWTDRPDGAAEFGYWIGAPFQGRGVATEAARLAVSRAAASGVDDLRACVFQDNPASARVLEKVGFERVGPCSGPSRARGGEAPTWLYARRTARFDG